MSTQQVVQTIDVAAAARQYSRIVRALPEETTAWTGEQVTAVEAAYHVAYVADRYADAERLMSMVIELGLDYQRFDAALQPLWEQAYFLTNQTDQMARRAGYLLALHVLSHEPEVCPGLARQLREQIMQYDRAFAAD